MIPDPFPWLPFFLAVMLGLLPTFVVGMLVGWAIRDRSVDLERRRERRRLRLMAREDEELREA